MLKNNGKTGIGRHFILSIFVVCLMFTALGFNIDHSYAVDDNQTAEDMGLEIDADEKLENSQIENDVLNADSNESEVLGATHTLNGGTFQTIQNKINSASAGDVIQLSGTFTASGLSSIQVNKKLTITSLSQATLDGQGKSSIFSLNEGSRGMTLSNLRFINGHAQFGSTIYIWDRDITVDNCVFEDNYASDTGGAIISAYEADRPRNALVKNCKFYNNRAGVAAGALALYGDNSRVENCIFDSNGVSIDNGLNGYGGAIQLSLDTVKCTAYAINCTFKNNWAKTNYPGFSHGGAGCVRDGTSYIGCTFINNRAGEGGALTFHSSGTIKDCTFINNSALEYGGALSTGLQYTSMDLDILNCKFDGNTAPLGGAVQLRGENIKLRNSNFTDNYASKNGGAVNIEATTVLLSGDNFINNTVNVDGGAVYIKGKDATVQDSTFISNDAIPNPNNLDDGLGGAIYVKSTNANILNNVFNFNTARNGSAVYYDKDGVNLKLTGNVMHENQAWVYALPISAQDIYFGDSERLSVVIHGGNNIARYGNLAVSNAIYNAAINDYINVDGFTPVKGATNSGELYQDDREYNIDILLTVKHEDGTVVYNNTLKSSYLGEINTVLTDLKPGKYHVAANHFEDTYYKAISNLTSFTVYPKIDNQITITSDKSVYDYEDVAIWTINITNNGPNNATEVYAVNLLPEGLIYYSDDSGGLYNPKTGVFNVSTLDVGEKRSFNILTVINKTGEIISRANITAHELDTNMANNLDERMIKVNPCADVMVTKTVNNTYPNYRDLVRWTIVVKNNGPDIAHNITLQDLIPKTLIPISISGNYNSSSGKWQIESLSVNEEVMFEIITLVNSTGLIKNDAYAKAAEYDYDMSNNRDDELIKVSPSCDLSIVKLVNASTVNYQDTVKWTLIIKNNGPDNATGVRISDILPIGFTYINSTLKYENGMIEVGDLEAGKEISVDIVCQVDITGNFTNYANVSGYEYDYDMTNNHDSEPISVNPACDLEVSKTVDESEPKFGEVIVWTIKVTNNGPDDAHDVRVCDVLPDSLIWIEDDSEGDYDPLTGIWHIETLDVDDEMTLCITCRVNKTGITENNVNVTALEFDYDLSNNHDNESIEVEPAADVCITKMVNNTAPNYKDLIKWTIVISNNGPDKATGIEVDEVIPDGLVLINSTATKGIYDNDLWAMCCLENGEVQTLEIICQVNRTGELINRVTIKANEYDPDYTNNNATQSINVPPAVDIEVIQKVTDPTPLFGESITWMITLKNNGPDNASEVMLSDVLPDTVKFTGSESTAGFYIDNVWHVGKLNAGDVEYLNITCIANSLGKIVNDANASSFEYDWNKSNNRDDAGINVLPVADLAIEKLVNKENPNYGDKITWTLRVVNNGPNAASNVVVYDKLPAQLKFIKSSDDKNFNGEYWHVGQLNVGEVRQLTVQCMVMASGKIMNSAKVWSDDYDPNPDNNHAQKAVSVAPASDLAITKIASKYKYSVGDVVSYMIEVVNNGPDTAYNVKIDEILDELLKLKSFKVSRGSFNKFTHVWTIKKLGFGESARLYIKAIAMGPGIIKNTVSVTSDSFDYDLSNNHDFAVVKVAKKALINASKDHKNEDNSMPENKLSTLEKHPTANPLALLVLSCVFSIIFLGGNISKKR